MHSKQATLMKKIQIYDMIETVFLKILWGNYPVEVLFTTKGKTIGVFICNVAINLKPENLKTFEEVLDYISTCLVVILEHDNKKFITMARFSEFFGSLNLKLIYDKGSIQEFKHLVGDEMMIKNKGWGKEHFKQAFRDFWISQEAGPGLFLMGGVPTWKPQFCQSCSD
ncbi:unnamed protein product [Owenia fusiformis]|uniref:Uncharacterized protein n=1 Tax=Owenia fusiformis TaxID=6347 RepID=A0A8J1XTR4_OWEFU|nr:unnamed protein product [Owenia fusiformis]